MIVKFAMVCFLLPMWVLVWQAFQASLVGGIVCALFTLGISAIIASGWEDLE